MKLAAAMCVLVMGFASFARGEPICVSGTLASYVALGAQGCSIGSNLLSGFETLPGINGAVLIPPSNISVTPQMNGSNVGLMFSVSSSASSGAILEALFSYRISGGSYTGESISASGTSASGNGAVTDIQNFCPGGSFGPDGVSGCSTGRAGLLVLLGDGSDSAAFAAVVSLSATDDITFDSGGAGNGNSAAGGAFSDAFTSAPASVPEPQTLALFIAGVLSVALIRFTGRNRRRLL